MRGILGDALWWATIGRIRPPQTLTLAAQARRKKTKLSKPRI
jgi:hypothetical protein